MSNVVSLASYKAQRSMNRIREGLEAERRLMGALEDLKKLVSKNNYDFLHGALGIVFYFINRNKRKKNDFLIEVLKYVALLFKL